MQFMTGGFGRVVAAVAVFAVFPANAELADVRDTYQVTVSASGDGVTAATPKVSAWPDDLPTPIFWLDCSRTNGWTIVRGQDGTNYVAEIPSLVGDGRFLTTNVTLEGTSFTGWSSASKPLPPALVEFDDLAGGPALDFGPFGSKRGMMFDPHLYESVGASKNLLADIGAMVAVWGSQNGGGYILGGGNNTGTSDVENYRWTRGWDNHTGDNSAVVYYWCTVFGGYASTIPKNPGFYMHDGIPASGNLVGMNGSWEAIGFSADSAKWHASGLGLGDTRSGYARNGGCRIAEIAIFGETLTQDQMRRAQVFLRRKWLGRGTRGWNGDANLGQIRNSRSDSAKYRAVIDVPDGETLTVKKLEGGRHGEPAGATAVEKTGDGVLAVDDGSGYSAAIEISGGTLLLSRKKAPASVADLPYGLYMRFDASVTNSMELENRNGTNFVTKMCNLASGRFKNREIYLSTYSTFTDREPWLSATPFGEEKPILDFGRRLTGTTGGRYFCFYYDTASGVKTRFDPNTCGTMIGLFSAHRGGGDVTAGPFQRSARWTGDDSYATALLKNYVVGDTSSSQIPNTNSESRIFINGQRLAVSSGFQHRGCQVVAYAVQPGAFTTLGAEQYFAAQDGNGCGGLMFGELLFWNRPLSDDELMEVQAYLSKKWLGTDLPGYSGAAEGAPDLQIVRSTGASSIDVPAGQTNRILKLDARAPLVKTGGGTLEIGPGSVATNLMVREGAVRAASSGAAVTNECQLAAGAAFHLDSSKPDSLELVNVNGTNFVRSWHSPNGLMAYQGTASRRPWLNTEASALLNGMPVVDFGLYSGSSTSKAGCYHMAFAKGFDSVCSAFIVRGSQEGGGSLLGENAQVSDYCRHGGMSGGLSIPIIANPSAAVKNGDFYLDGVKTNCQRALPTGGYEIVDVHPVSGTHVSALALYKSSYMMGGQRIAEIVLYERPLSEREKVATRNYLVRKWFPDRELQPLPGDDGDFAVSLAGIDSDGVPEVSATSAMSAATLTGSGTIAKTGAAALSLSDISGFSGKLDVSEGTLVLSGCDVSPNSAGVAVAAGATLRTVGARYVDGLYGVGSVDGDVTVRVLERDCSVQGVLSVSGTLTFAGGMAVHILNIPEPIPDEIVVARATAFAGTANLAGAALDGVPDGADVRLTVRGTNLVLRRIRGFQILLR